MREISRQNGDTKSTVGKSMIHEYAPLRRQMYELPDLPTCEVSEIGKLDFGSVPVWNLFWLSVPTIDTVPGSGHDWWRHYSPINDAAKCITADVLGDEVLHRKLMMHPVAFIAWFQREDLSIYDTCDVFGEANWRETVLHRASTVVDRLRMMADPVLSNSKNVVYANFGRKRA